MEIAEIKVETADTLNEIKRIGESSHKISLAVMKEYEEGEKISADFEDLKNLVSLVQERIAQKQQEVKNEKNIMKNRVKELKDNILSLDIGRIILVIC